MYLELLIVANYGAQDRFTTKLESMIGKNAVDSLIALLQTSLSDRAEDLKSTVIAAERIQNKIYILYFFEGDDTIRIHIAGENIVGIRQQAERITRGMPKLFESAEAEMKASGVIYSVVPAALDVPVLSGEKTSFKQRLVDAFTDRWMPRLLAPAVAFWVAAAFLSNTNFFQSAMIGLGAALVSVIIEGLVFARKADEWKWKEVAS